MDYGSSSRVEALEPKAGVLEGLPGGGTSRVESEGWDTPAAKLERNSGAQPARNPPPRKMTAPPPKATGEVTLPA